MEIITPQPSIKFTTLIIVAIAVLLIVLGALAYLYFQNPSDRQFRQLSPFISVLSILLFVAGLFFFFRVWGNIIWHLAPNYSNFEMIERTGSDITLGIHDSRKRIQIPVSNISEIKVLNDSIKTVGHNITSVQRVVIQVAGTRYTSGLNGTFYTNTPKAVTDKIASMLNNLNLKIPGSPDTKPFTGGFMRFFIGSVFPLVLYIGLYGTTVVALMTKFTQERPL